MPEKQIKRGDVIKVDGIFGKVTFYDKDTKYIRAKNKRWQITCYLKDLEDISVGESHLLEASYE